MCVVSAFEPVADDAADSARDPAHAGLVVHETAYFVLRAPAGWHFARQRAFQEFERTDRFECMPAPWGDGCQFSFVADDGSYFVLSVDNHTEGATPDRIWTLAASKTDDSMEVVAERSACGLEACQVEDANEDPCPVGNGRLEIFAVVYLKGHAFAFEFGNLKHEDGVPLEPFRRVLESFKAK